MYPELLSQSIIPLLVDTFDPDKKGVAIEIGVGTSNYYCLKYKDAGLACIAVDPIAYPPFLELAQANNIRFEEACIYDKEEEITLYSSHHSDLSSVNKDWWGVDQNNQKKIKAILLNTLLLKYQVSNITFLKADTEGSELEIIKQLKDADPSKLPAIVEFEYGGGGLRQSGNGGWNKKYFDKVLAILKILKELNYEQGLVLDSNDAMPVFIDLKSITNLDEIFKLNYEYGNFLAFKTSIKNVAPFESVLLKTQTTELEKMIADLTAENSALKLKILKSQYLKRLINKVKAVFSL